MAKSAHTNSYPTRRANEHRGAAEGIRRCSQPLLQRRKQEVEGTSCVTGGAPGIEVLAIRGKTPSVSGPKKEAVALIEINSTD